MKASSRWTVAGGVFGLLAVVATTAWIGTGYAYSSAAAVADQGINEPGISDKGIRGKGALEARRRRLQARLAETAPKGHYLVVDQTHNRLYLKKGADTVLMAICSAGSGATLADPSEDRKWVFATPRGRFQVLSRIRNPVWKKPDWAFIEEGEPIPTDPSERFEYGVLGEYALYFGDGYMIHGTLYERLLGRSVTHGCIRLGRDDLRTVYAATRLGTSIYIF